MSALPKCSRCKKQFATKSNLVRHTNQDTCIEAPEPVVEKVKVSLTVKRGEQFYTHTFDSRNVVKADGIDLYTIAKDSGMTTNQMYEQAVKLIGVPKKKMEWIFTEPFKSYFGDTLPVSFRKGNPGLINDTKTISMIPCDLREIELRNNGIVSNYVLKTSNDLLKELIEKNESVDPDEDHNVFQGPLFERPRAADHSQALLAKFRSVSMTIDYFVTAMNEYDDAIKIQTEQAELLLNQE